MLPVLHGGIPCAAGESAENTEGVGGGDAEVEERDGAEDREGLLDVGCFRGPGLSLTNRNTRTREIAPATLIPNGPILRFALKLTTFSPKAMTPFRSSSNSIGSVCCQCQ